MSRLIKKYKNRRLYDTEKSQYITMEDLSQYIVDGILFHVNTADNGEDITTMVLLQILIEMQATPAANFLSASLLRQLIALAHHPMHQTYQSMVEGVFSQLNEVSLQRNSLDLWRQQMDVAMENWQALFKPK